MPEARPISGDDVVQAFERLGFHIADRHGFNVVLERVQGGNTSRCVVPLQPAIPAGALNGILRQADITQEEFQRALRPRA